MEGHVRGFSDVGRLAAEGARIRERPIQTEVRPSVPEECVLKNVLAKTRCARRAAGDRHAPGHGERSASSAGLCGVALGRATYYRHRMEWGRRDAP